MSSPTTIEAIPVEKLEQLLECTICKRTVKEPKTLSCFHSFCKSCLEQLVQIHQENAGGEVNKFHCPFCRTEFTVNSKEGVAGIASNPFICNMLNVLAVESRIKGIPCAHCQKPSVGRCVKCEIFMCEKCLESHNGYPGFRDHSVLSMEELSKPENHAKIRGRPRCKEHGDEPLKHFCETCEELICRDCKEYDHKSHECMPLKKAEEQKTEDLKTRGARLAKQVTDCNKALEVMEATDQSLKDDFETAKVGIRERKQEILAAVGRLLDLREKALMDEIEAVYKTKHRELQKQLEQTHSHAEKMQKSVGVCRSLVNNGNAEEIVSSHKPVRRNVDMVAEECPKNLKPVNDGRILFKQLSMNGFGRECEEILESLGNINDKTDDRKLPADAITRYLPNNLKVVIYQGDISKENADIIVNSCNQHLDKKDGVSLAIAKAAGSLVKKECESYVNMFGPLSWGDVLQTGPGDMNCQMIIHAVSPLWRKHKRDGSVKLIRKVLHNIFSAASFSKAHSVALPGLGCGCSHVPKEVFAEAIASFIKDLDQSLTSKAVKVAVPFEVRLVDVDKETTTAIDREIIKLSYNF